MHNEHVVNKARHVVDGVPGTARSNEEASLGSDAKHNSQQNATEKITSARG